jgi:hypothetical protein
MIPFRHVGDDRGRKIAEGNVCAYVHMYVGIHLCTTNINKIPSENGHFFMWDSDSPTSAAMLFCETVIRRHRLRWTPIRTGHNQGDHKSLFREIIAQNVAQPIIVKIA